MCFSPSLRCWLEGQQEQSENCETRSEYQGERPRESVLGKCRKRLLGTLAFLVL